MRFLCLISLCAALRPPESLHSLTNAVKRNLANLPAVPSAPVDAAHRALDGCGVAVPVNNASASPEAVKAQVGAVAASLKAKTHEVTKEALSELTDVVDHVRAATPSLKMLKGKKNNILKGKKKNKSSTIKIITKSSKIKRRTKSSKIKRRTKPQRQSEPSKGASIRITKTI